MMRPKIAFIGFNRCGTTSLHRLLARSLTNSLHFRKRDEAHIAPTIFSNFSMGLPLLSGFDEFEAYSDLNYMRRGMILEGQILFREINDQYPDYYYVLNAQNMKNWITSRINHPVMNTTMLKYVQQIVGGTEKKITDLWTKQWIDHHRDMIAFFASQNDAKFTVFDIETDEISHLQDFLSDNYDLNLPEWKQRNKGTHNG